MISVRRPKRCEGGPSKLTAYTCGEDDDADVVLEEAFVGEDPGQDGEGRDGVGSPEKEEEGAKVDGRAVDEAVIDPFRDGCAHGKGDDHADERDRDRDFGVAAKEGKVDFEADEEQEQGEANVGDEVEVRDALRREDVAREAGHAAEGGRADQDSGDDFGNDARLAEVAECEVQEAREGDDDERLGDEEHERVGGVEGDRRPVALVKDRGGFGPSSGGSGSCSSGGGESGRDGGIGRADEGCGWGEEVREFKARRGSPELDDPSVTLETRYSLAVTWAAMVSLSMGRARVAHSWKGRASGSGASCSPSARGALAR
jgi:hypothetical protein